MSNLQNISQILWCRKQLIELLLLGFIYLIRREKRKGPKGSCFIMLHTQKKNRFHERENMVLLLTSYDG